MMVSLVAMVSMARINIAAKRSTRKIGKIGNFLLTLIKLYNIIYYVRLRDTIKKLKINKVFLDSEKYLMYNRYTIK